MTANGANKRGGRRLQFEANGYTSHLVPASLALWKVIYYGAFIAYYYFFRCMQVSTRCKKDCWDPISLREWMAENSFRDQLYPNRSRGSVSEVSTVFAYKTCLDTSCQV